MTERTEQHAYFVLGFKQVFLANGFGDQAQAIAGPVGLEVRLNRDHDEPVLRLAKDVAKLLCYANDFIWIALDLDCLAERVAIREKPGADFSADEGDRSMAAHFFIRYAAAIAHLNVLYRRHVRGDAVDLNALD